jgi:hypothetical protein
MSNRPTQRYVVLVVIIIINVLLVCYKMMTKKYGT